MTKKEYIHFMDSDSIIKPYSLKKIDFKIKSQNLGLERILIKWPKWDARHLKYMSLDELLKIWPKEVKMIKREKLNSNLTGLKVCVKGRLRGARRARKLEQHYGSIGPNSYNKRSKSNQQTIYTKWGTWNLKVSLSRAISLQHLH